MTRLVTMLSLMVTFVAVAGAQSKPVYRIGQDGVKSPVLTREVKPTYTKAAKDRGLQGTVELALVVQSDGVPSDDIKVTKSLDPELDEQAIIAVRQWRFR